jgi:hypothetical protein
MKLLPFLSKQNNHWWIKINTAKPSCTYYFGPFDSKQEAKTHQPGYVEDLVREKARGIAIKTKWCLRAPKSLTIVKE